MSSKLELKFINLWETFFSEIKLIPEYKVIPDRRYRFDYVHLETRIAIEINGGRWVKSGHSSGTGLLRDYEKNNLALLNGWVVFYLCDVQINKDNLTQIAEFIKGKSCDNLSVK